MPNNVDELYLSKEGLGVLTKEIFNNVNTRIEERITKTIDPNSDVNHVPSASAVYEAVKGLSKIKSFVIASGNIADANVTPDPNTIYLVRKSATSYFAKVYVWVNGYGFVNCSTDATGGTPIDIAGIPNDMIIQIVSDSYAETDPAI